MSRPRRDSEVRLLLLALVLSLGGAISLGITRFAYGLLLPPMRADLQWSSTLAGAMNTANAGGYLLGALLTPALMRRYGATALLLWGAASASLFMGLSGFFTGAGPLLLQRVLAGVASAFVLIGGSLLAVRLGSLQPARSGLLIGIYYGGTGVGIVLSALLVPALLEAAAARPHGWAWPAVPGGRALAGRGAGLAAAATGRPQRRPAYLSRPSARIASCTAGRAATRSR